MMTVRHAITAVLGLLALCVAGCRTLDNSFPLVYIPVGEMKFPGQFPALAVRSTMDGLCGKIITADPNSDTILLLPLWPYSNSYLDPLQRFTYMEEDIAGTVRQLACEDIQMCGVARNVYGSMEYDLARAPSDAYRLDLKVVKAIWSRNLTYYGLSMGGCFLWPFGFPVSYGHVEIELVASMTDPSGKKLGEKTISSTLPCTEWVYDQVSYRPSISEFRTAEMLPGIIADIRSFAAGFAPK